MIIKSPQPFFGNLVNKNFGIMADTVADPHSLSETTHLSGRRRFLGWCEGQKEFRFLWLGLILFGQIGAIVPITAISIAFFGNNHFVLWILMFVFNVPVFVLNLAAQPLKRTLSALLFATIGSLGLVIASFIIYFM